MSKKSRGIRGGASGLYFRGSPVVLAPGFCEIVLMSQQGGEELEERWIVFSKEIENDSILVGNVEIAFRFSIQPENIRKIEPLVDSTLVVFFLTILSTHTGFLLQGRYRTTPSRGNITTLDAWNKRLVIETGDCLVETLGWRLQADFPASHLLSHDKRRNFERCDHIWGGFARSGRQATFLGSSMFSSPVMTYRTAIPALSIQNLMPEALPMKMRTIPADIGILEQALTDGFIISNANIAMPNVEYSRCANWKLLLIVSAGKKNQLLFPFIGHFWGERAVTECRHQR